MVSALGAISDRRGEHQRDAERHRRRPHRADRRHDGDPRLTARRRRLAQPRSRPTSARSAADRSGTGPAGSRSCPGRRRWMTSMPASRAPADVARRRGHVHQRAAGPLLRPAVDLRARLVGPQPLRGQDVVVGDEPRHLRAGEDVVVHVGQDPDPVPRRRSPPARSRRRATAASRRPSRAASRRRRPPARTGRGPRTWPPGRGGSARRTGSSPARRAARPCCARSHSS